jgi:hypothetical protein
MQQQQMTISIWLLQQSGQVGMQLALLLVRQLVLQKVQQLLLQLVQQLVRQLVHQLVPLQLLR